ncbi:MAG: biotin--[acetyl-CoA-carboxylase] ligase [Clostridiales bacterium]|nr:biotin--[acetyl-CoA-carboxylase] ligase [Clostridiales bacterium]
MKTEILKMLTEAQDYLSGQTLCDYFHVSRTAVWKAIRQLQEEGYEIEAVRNRGYRLIRKDDIYSQTGIASALKTKWLGHNLVFMEATDSSNNQVRRLAEQGAAEGTVVVADRQDAGKGRRGRSWLSAEGSGVWMSFLLRPQFQPERASMLTLVTALAVADGICETTGLDCGIKWPNDLVVGGKKVCGILTEMSSDMDTIQYVVVGIGINVGMRKFPEELRETATSLELCLGEPEESVNRVKLIDAVLRHWEERYDAFLQKMDLSLLQDDYQRKLVNVENQVRVLGYSEDYVGISHGITPTGELIVELNDGEVRKVTSGEVSVRGVYGYV